MMRGAIAVLVLSLLLAMGSVASADPGVPTSVFGGAYFAMSSDGQAVAFKLSDGHLRWEVAGIPVSNYGVNNVVMATAVGFDSPLVLVLGGAIGGTYFAASSDGTAMAFKMPDGTLRWEINGIPLFQPR